MLLGFKDLISHLAEKPHNPVLLWTSRRAAEPALLEKLRALKKNYPNLAKISEIIKWQKKIEFRKCRHGVDFSGVPDLGLNNLLPEKNCPLPFFQLPGTQIHNLLMVGFTESAQPKDLVTMKNKCHSVIARSMNNILVYVYSDRLKTKEDIKEVESCLESLPFIEYAFPEPALVTM